jgi:pimeloyl-ACP methyl ester carboxylesterase
MDRRAIPASHGGDRNMNRIEFASHGVTLVGSEAGPAGGQPILFLHGGGQTRQSWRRAMTEAADRGYRAISLDLRGHGESGWSPDGDYDFRLFARDVGAVVDQVGGRPVLVGASLGGISALLVAGAPDTKAGGLIMVDVSVRLEPEGTAEIGNFMSSAPEGFASLEEAAEAVAAYLPHRPRPKDTSGLLRNLRRREDGRLHWHWDPAFMRPQVAAAPFDESELDRAAEALTVPTLLIRGALSRVVSEAGARAFLALAPHAEYVNVEGADHMVAGDANDSFNEAVFGFLARRVSVSPFNVAP